MNERFDFLFGDDSVFFQMTSHVGIVELFVIFGLVLGWLGFEVIKTDRDIKRTRSTSGDPGAKKSAFE